VSRIRSIHPGLWTDERFVSVSPYARLLFMGLWTECDDQGLFEWSPLKLKMRLLPADNVDAAALLLELSEAGSVLSYEVAGRQYGAVRNFAKYQRPKKPNSLYPETPESRAFCARSSELHGDEDALVRNQSGTTPPKSPQMEDGGGRMKEEGSEAVASGAETPSRPPSAIDLKAAVFASGVPLLVGAGTKDRSARSMLGRWRQDFGDGAVLDALSAATAESPSDPIPWITRKLESRNGRSSITSLRGSRPDPALDMWRQANAELAAESAGGGEEARLGARVSLPAIGSG
jgi:hypothetical protein